MEAQAINTAVQALEASSLVAEVKIAVWEYKE